jgi:hypothetical protein
MKIKEEYNPTGNTRSFEDLFQTYLNKYINFFWTYINPNSNFSTTNLIASIIKANY